MLADMTIIIQIFNIQSQNAPQFPMQITTPTLTPLILIITFILLTSTQCQLDSSRMRIVDRNENHVFVRGNLPILNNTFQFQTLYETLSQMTNMTGFRIVIYSLLNHLTAKQTKSRYIEQNLFNEQWQYKYNNSFHLYKNHDIIGSFISPAQYPSWLRKYALKYYNYTTYDKIPVLLENIQRNMRSPFKTIVYVHCSQGVDRAGYVAAAYKMKNMGMSLAEVTKENLDIMKELRGHIHFNSYNGLQWYCLFLGRTEDQCLIHVVGANHGNTSKDDPHPHHQHHKHKPDHKHHSHKQPGPEL